MKFHTLKVNYLHKTTSNSIEIGFEIPSEYSTFYTFQPGQFISIKVNIDGAEYKRDYSIFSAPFENTLHICVKAIEEGKVSKYLVENTKLGDIFEITQPMGKFGIPIKPNEKRTLAFFSAGSGITPIYSILKNILHQEKNTSIYLFYSNKTENDVIFKDELDQLAQINPHFNYFNFYSQQSTKDPLFTGRLNSNKLKLIINQLIEWDEVDEVLICGPNEMTQELINACIEFGVYRENIHFELFNTIVPIHLFEENKNEGITEVEITLEKQKFIIQWEKKGESLLDILLDEGLDPPYSCKGGVCSACTCKINEGTIKMDPDQMVLLDSDIEKGLFLPCMTFHSDSQKIIINFDDI